MMRDRSYQDLDAKGKRRYDKLRRLELRLRKRREKNAAMLKAGGISITRENQLRARIDRDRHLEDVTHGLYMDMLGLRPEVDEYVVGVRYPGCKPWRGSATHHWSDLR